MYPPCSLSSSLQDGAEEESTGSGGRCTGFGRYGLRLASGRRAFDLSVPLLLSAGRLCVVSLRCRFRNSMLCWRMAASTPFIWRGISAGGLRLAPVPERKVRRPVTMWRWEGSFIRTQAHGNEKLDITASNKYHFECMNICNELTRHYESANLGCPNCQPPELSSASTCDPDLEEGIRAIF